MISKTTVLITVLTGMLSFSLPAADKSPGDIVKHTVDQVLSVLKDDRIDEIKQKKIIFDLVKERINFKEMSRRILATNWNVASEKQKQEFISLFEQIVLNTYWARLKRYSGERIDYVSVSSDNEDYATVDTIIIKDRSDIQIPISYRMKRFVSVWFAYDFTVERLSLVQSYRNEYRAIAKNHGLDGLLEYMQRDIENTQSKNI